MLLQIPQRGGHGRVMGLLDMPGHLLVTEPPQQRHGLGGAEGQVEPGHLPGRMCSDPLPGGRVVAVEDPAERLAGDLESHLELQTREAGAHPAAGGLAVAVVVVDLGVGDRVEVVGSWPTRGPSARCSTSPHPPCGGYAGMPSMA